MDNTNDLINETSPYLLQHAHHPVAWHAWNQQTLQKARKENKPILLSIGYAACHWCHVMAHESFEDNSTAELMNQYFINIKVDREERPDLDKIYQTAHYFLTQQSGGWPLTLFLSPDDLVPFFSGTYFPLKAQAQRPSFKDILTNIAHLYKTRLSDIKEQNHSLMELLTHSTTSQETIVLNDQPIFAGLHDSEKQFDAVYGGFGSAPKFPRAPLLLFLRQTESNIPLVTLTKMANSGLYDQLGGGFFRYAVDQKWRIPHFEKMLYDNALLLSLYVDIAAQNSDAFFINIAKQTADWIMQTMQAPQGGYYASLDADSNKEEGTYYSWECADIEKTLTRAEYEITQLYYGLNEAPNFEKKWHLYVAKPVNDIANELNRPTSDIISLLQSAQKKLLLLRTAKAMPYCDQKILTGWNSLTIKAMALAGHFLKQPHYTQSALQAFHFIKTHLWKNNQLDASYQTQPAGIAAYLDDYAYLIDATLTLLKLSWDDGLVEFAVALTENMLNHFYDQTDGGFFFTANDQPIVLYRPKTFMDDAIPSGNGIATQVLIQLGQLLGECRYLHAAEKTLKAAWPSLISAPAEHGSLLIALSDYLALTAPKQKK